MATQAFTNASAMRPAPVTAAPSIRTCRSRRRWPAPAARDASSINPKTQTPAKNNLLFFVFVEPFLLRLYLPVGNLGEMTSIGTLFAFILVCIGVWVMRRKMPEIPRAFKTPMVPLVPILGILVYFMMVFLPMDTWIRLIVWMLIGLDIYLVYGAKNSHLGDGTSTRRGMRIARYTGIALALLLVVVGFLHQYGVGFDNDRTLLYVSIIFAAVHLVIFALKVNRPSQKIDMLKTAFTAVFNLYYL